MKNHETKEKNHVMDQRIEGLTELNRAESRLVRGGALSRDYLPTVGPSPDVSIWPHFYPGLVCLPPV